MKRKISKNAIDINKMRQLTAADNGFEYFDAIRESIKTTLKEIEKNWNDWEILINNLAKGKKTYDNEGNVISQKYIIEYIVQTMSSLQQLNVHYSKGAMACAKLAKAFSIEV